MDLCLSPSQIAALYAVVAEAEPLQPLVVLVRQLLDADSARLELIDSDDVTDIAASGEMPGGAPFDPQNRETASIELGPARLVTITVHRGADRLPAPAPARPLLDEIAVHLRDVLRLHGRLAVQAPSADWSSLAFDAFTVGVVVVDAEGMLVHANDAARALVARSAGLVFGAKGSAVSTLGAAEGRPLRLLIGAAARGQGGGLSLVGRDGVALAVLASPLIGKDASRAAGKVLLLLHRHDAAARLDPATLTALFGLSPAQAGLCVQLAAGKTFEEASQRRQIAVTTARTHFRSILVRTGTQNLRDLLRLLGALSCLRMDG